jgi:hypothetical protein
MTKKKVLVIEGKPKLFPLINVSPASENIDSRPEGERNRLDLSPEHVLALLEKYPNRQLTRKPCQTRVPLSYARRY